MSICWVRLWDKGTFISQKNNRGFVGHCMSSWDWCLLVSLRCLSGVSWYLLVLSELAVFLQETVLEKWRIPHCYKPWPWPRINPRPASAGVILVTHATAFILPCASRPCYDSAGPIPAYAIPVDSILRLTNPYPIPDPTCMTTDHIPAVATRNLNLLESSRKFSTSLALRKYCLVLQSSGYAIFFCHVLLVSISFYPVLLDM